MKISFPRLSFFARHGVMLQEKEVGGQFEVALTMTLDDGETADALLDDRLDGTVNYAAVYQIVREEMAIPSALLEHVVHRLSRRLLRTFPRLKTVCVRLTKAVPPIEGFDGNGVSVETTVRRRMVVWDFDGTLADTFPGIIRTMNATFRFHGLPERSDEEITRTIGLPLLESIIRLQGVAEAEALRYTETYRRLFEEIGAPATRLFPDVETVVRTLAARGCFQCVATSRGRRSVVELLTKLGLAPYIDEVVAVEDVREAKPAPEAVLTLCERTSVSPGETVVIGDAPYDMEMARRAGVVRRWAIGREAERLKSEGAERAFPNASALLSALSGEQAIL